MILFTSFGRWLQKDRACVRIFKKKGGGGQKEKKKVCSFFFFCYVLNIQNGRNLVYIFPITRFFGENA